MMAEVLVGVVVCTAGTSMALTVLVGAGGMVVRMARR